MRRKSPLTDLGECERVKEERRQRAACRHSLLAFVREAVRRKALNRRERIATLDDAYSCLAEHGKPASELGNAAGSIFQLAEWEPLPCWTPSRRKTKHARMNRLWRLRG